MIHKFLYFQQNIRIYHWKSKNYNQHVTSGEFYEKLDELKALEKYLNDLFKVSIELLEGLGSSLELLTMGKEIKENHTETIIKLYKEFRK